MSTKFKLDFKIILILILSIGIFAFITWFIYAPKQEAGLPGYVYSLPKQNAVLNLLASLWILTGFIFIKAKKIKLHITSMVGAIVCSSLFLISYLIYHHYVGDTTYSGGWPLIYYPVLISHIVVSFFAIPLVLVAIYLALSKNYNFHRRIGKITIPVWLYLSVTGVVIYLMLNG